MHTVFPDHHVARFKYLYPDRLISRERFLLTPSFAFCIAICFLLLKITKTDLPAGKPPRITAFSGAVVILLLLYSVKTITRNHDWKNNLTLFESGILSSPNSTRAHASLAYEYKLEAQASADPALKGSYLEKALKEFNTSLEIMPENTYASYNMGVMEYELGHLEEAKKLYLKTIRYDPKDLNALNNLTAICVQREEYDDALKYYFMTLDLKPGDADVVGNIGAIYQRQGNFAKAIEFDEKALALNPANINVYNNLIGIYDARGDTAKVRYYYEMKLEHEGR